MRNLFESILRPDDDILQGVEFESVLKKYHWRYKRAEWQGKTLYVVFDGRGYMDDLDKVAEELNCRSFKIYPWAIINTSGPLDGIVVQAETRIDITAPKVTGCKFICKQPLTIRPSSKASKPTYSHNDFECEMIEMVGIDGVTFSGNNFNNIDTIHLTKVGPRIEKIVMSWNFITNELKGGIWSTYPRPKGEPKLDLNPLKALGLDKHFKNVKRLQISGGLNSGYPDKLVFTLPSYEFYQEYTKRYSDISRGIDRVEMLSSGWQLMITKF